MIACTHALLDRFPVMPMQELIEHLEFYRVPETSDADFQTALDILRGMDAANRRFCARYQLLCAAAGPSNDCFLPAR